MSNSQEGAVQDVASNKTKEYNIDQVPKSYPKSLTMAPAPIATHVSDEINNAMDKNSIFHKKGADLVNFAVGGTGGKSTVPTMPDFTSKEEEQRYAKEHLACAFRVFAENGFDEGLSGHMSLRDPINPRTFWINPYSMHFADIKVSDLVCVTEDAEVVHGIHSVNAAGFAIHSEIHQAHPWINAVCHAHSTAGKAYSVIGKTIPPVTQDSLKFYGKTGILHEYHGPVLNTEEGKAIANEINDETNMVILRNHGLLSVGTTIDEACYWFLSFNRCCEAQMMLDAVAPYHGPPRLIDEEVARQSAKLLGARQRGWLHFQPYYTNMLEKTKGTFLQ